jgi:hypothetical protein
MSSFGRDYMKQDDSFNEGRKKALEIFADIRLDNFVQKYYESKGFTLGKRTKREDSCDVDPFSQPPSRNKRTIRSDH